MTEYVTKAIILGSEVKGETDRTIDIFTKDFGRLRVRVAAGRKVLSKFSPHSQVLNIVVARLVKKNSYTLADILNEKPFGSRNFSLPLRRRFFELVYLLKAQLPIGVSDLHLWFSLTRALHDGRVELGRFLKLIGHDCRNAKCAFCGSGPVTFFFLTDQSFLCSRCGRKSSSGKVIYLE